MLTSLATGIFGGALLGFGIKAMTGKVKQPKDVWQSMAIGAFSGLVLELAWESMSAANT